MNVEPQSGMLPPRSVEELDLRISTPGAEVIDALRRCDGDFVVLGAGGKMGLHFCQMLRRALDEFDPARRLVAVSRFGSPGATASFDASGIETLSADLSDPADEAKLPAAANVLYLAGVKFGTGSSPELLRLMNVEVPARMARRYRDSRIVALSTGCVYSFTTPASGGSKEIDATDPPGDYARSCLGREESFAEVSLASGTPVALIRLNYSVEMRYGVLVDIARKVLAGDAIDVGMGYVNVIWQGDAVSQILRTFPLAQSPPLVLNITGVETLSVRDLAMRFAKRLGKTVTLRGAESPTAWLSNSAVATRLFGPPKVDTQTLIDWTADWVAGGRPLLGKPTHFENREGKY